MVRPRWRIVRRPRLGSSVGCVWTQEPGDAPAVTIHEAEVNTGQRIIHLNVADIPRVWEWESRVSEMIEERQLNERAA
jgi:hypothetical protein